MARSFRWKRQIEMPGPVGLAEKAAKYFGPSGFPVGFLVGPRARTHTEGRLSRAIKRIRVSVSVKSATNCTIKRALRALHTLPRTLSARGGPASGRKRTLNRHSYSVTLNRTAYTIQPTSSHPSTENPPLIPEAPTYRTLTSRTFSIME